ncbi:MAG: hypothetical protein JXQ76_03520 [Campylobacterales bacterium]|nr:hypothetical protein [Campylobacterales bacterium]
MKLKTLSQSLFEAIIMPFQAMRLRYVPLLMIYFSYGATAFTAVADNFLVKKDLGLSAVEYMELSFWLMIPWSIKMIFGQIVDSITLFGSNRKIYVYIGALLMAFGIWLVAAVAGRYEVIARFDRDGLYMVAMIIMTIGIVMQDVVADTMSTEVTKPNQSESERKRELATIQVLARLSLAMAGFAVSGLGGWMASIYSYETIFKLALFIPVLSIIGVTFVKLNPVASSPLNKKIFFGGIGFAIFIIFMGVMQIPYSQEIIFVVSLAIVLLMLREVIDDLDANTIRHIKMAMIVIFVYRAMPSVGPALQWWEIDVLGFDEAFFGVLAQIGATLGIMGMWISGKFIVDKNISTVLIAMTVIYTILSLPLLGMYYDLHTALGVSAKTVAVIDTALASPFDYIAGVIMLTLVAIYAPEGKKATWFALMASFMNIALAAAKLLTKYLNEIFVVTREIEQNGVIITHADYSQLGILMWVVIIVGFVVPIVTILRFNPDK